MLALLLVAAPWMIASVHLVSTAIDLGLALLAWGLVLAGRGLRGRPVVVPRVGWVLLGLVAFEGLQAVPLPPALLRLLSPHTAEVYAYTLGDLGLWPAWRPLSLDPVQTGVELARHATALLVFLGAGQLAMRPERRSLLLRLLAGSGLFTVLLALGHKLAGAQHIFGAYPTPPQGWLFATFVNPNHFAAYLDLLAPVCLGLAVGAGDRSRVALWGLAFVLLGMACLLTLSRGGILALGVGVTLWAALERRRRALGREGDAAPSPEGPPALTRSLRPLAAPLFIGVTLLAAAWLALDPILDELSTLTAEGALAREQRFEAWADTLALVRDAPLFGVGRGAFAVAFPMYRRSAAHSTLYHPENQVVAAVAELGVVAGLLLAGTLLWAWVAALRARDRDPKRVGVLAGLAALAVHEMADFATSFGGVAVPAAVALGSVFPFRDRTGRRWARLGVRWAAAGSVVLSLACGGALLAARGRLLDDDVERVRRALEARPVVGPEILEVVARRPTDHVVALLVAAALEAQDPKAAFRWVGRAMYLAPTDPQAHALAAELLARAGAKTQAQLEYRLAVKWGAPAATVVARAARWFRAPEDLLAAVPETEAHAVVAHLTRTGRLEEALAVGQRLLAGRPGDAKLLHWTAEAALRAGDADALQRLAEARVQVDPEAPRGYLHLFQARRAAGDLDGALAALRAGLARRPGDPELSLALARALLRDRKDPRAALATLEQMPLSRQTGIRVQAQVLRGQALQALGRSKEAGDAFRTAVRLAPDALGPRLRLGDHYQALGDYEAALDAYRDALARARSDAQRASVEARIDAAERGLAALEQYRRARALEAGP
ncbi:MAG: hypothetical protein D6729_06295 [Deltaproteobacteria bacterium]|nr:MAG: hypothetical protein D6729_06295 [Deltaproteobacteria bacterium]